MTVFAEGLPDGTGRGTLPPGPISNHLLLRPDGVTPLPKLKKITSFRGVNHVVWNFLFGIYGGGPPLPRVTLDLYDETPLPSQSGAEGGQQTPRSGAVPASPMAHVPDPASPGPGTPATPATNGPTSDEAI